VDVTEPATEEVAESNKPTLISPEHETLSLSPNQSARSHISLADDPDEHDNTPLDVDEILPNPNTECQGREHPVRKTDCPEQIFDDPPHDGSPHHGETVWKYTRFVGHKIRDDGREYVKVQWEPTWEPLIELSGGEEAFKAYQGRQSGQVRVEGHCRQHRSKRRKPGRRRKGQRS